MKEAGARTASADSVFWLERDRLARCPTLGCETPTFSPLSDAVQEQLFSGNGKAPPVLRESAGVLYVSGGTAIFRIPGDFSSELALIHADPVGVTGLAVIGGYVYFARSMLAGEIRRCPDTGCETSEVVTAAPGWPNDLIGDEKAIYWTHRAPESYGSSDEQLHEVLSRFSLDGTSISATDIATFEDIQPSWERPSPAMNAHHLYWCETELITDGANVNPIAGLIPSSLMRSTIHMVAR